MAISEGKVWPGAGFIAGVVLLPLLHLAAVDLENKKGTAAAYLAHADSRHLSITYAGTAGLLATGGVVLFLVGLRRAVGRNRSLMSDFAFGVGAIAVLGLVLSFLGAVLAAVAANEGYPFEAVRPMGLLAENAVAVLLPALAGPAALVAFASLHDRLLPRTLGWVSAIFAVLLVLSGVLAPGSGLLLALLWLVLTSGTLLFGSGVPGSNDAMNDGGEDRASM